MLASLFNCASPSSHTDAIPGQCGYFLLLGHQVSLLSVTGVLKAVIAQRVGFLRSFLFIGGMSSNSFIQECYKSSQQGKAKSSCHKGVSSRRQVPYGFLGNKGGSHS